MVCGHKYEIGNVIEPHCYVQLQQVDYYFIELSRSIDKSSKINQ